MFKSKTVDIAKNTKMIFELKKPESVTLKRLKQVSKYANEDEQA